MLSQVLRFTMCVLLSAQSFAQAPNPPQRFGGNLVSVDHDAVTVTDKGGKSTTVTMKSGWTLSVNRPGNIEALKAGEFIASANVPVDSNTGKSTEVRILEPGYEPEQGTHAVSATNANMMTHGTVRAVTRTNDGVDLEVQYPSGSRHLIVASGTPVTVSDPVNHDALKPGVAVEGVTRVDPDGIARASRLQLTK